MPDDNWLSQAVPTGLTTMVHSGLSPTFLRFPHVPPNAGELKGAGAKAAIYGIPWEATLGRSGAGYGPHQIRDVTRQLIGYDARLECDLERALSPVDCGDCQSSVGNAERTFERAQADLAEIIAAGALPVILGGDHACTIPGVRAVAAVHPNPGLVIVDAHLDAADAIDDEPLSHACSIARAVEAGFDPRHIVVIGVTSWMHPKETVDICIEQGMTVIWMEEVWEHGTGWAADRAREIAGGETDGIYLSFDVDVLDVAFGAGTGAPTAGGMSSREGIELTRKIAKGGLLGIDVVETAPSLEATSATSLFAARVVLEGLGAVCSTPE